MGRKNKQQRRKKQKQKSLAALMPTSIATAAAATTSTTATAATFLGDADEGNISATSRSGIGVAVGIAAAKEDGGTAETTLTCTHGSTIGNFVDGSDYEKAATILMSILQAETAKLNVLNITEFNAKHENLTKDPEFMKYVFAFGIKIFLKNYTGKSSWDQVSTNLQCKLYGILCLGFIMKYNSDDDHEKITKYLRDIHTERGIINCLHRETSDFCHCMQSLKSEAKTMEKFGMCMGCFKNFPKRDLRLCNRCNNFQYCSNGCMKKNWPKHKTYCKQYIKSKKE